MENRNDFIIVTEGRMKHLLPIGEILYVEAVRMYSIFHTKALSPSNCARQYVSTHNLGKTYQELKGKNFLRVHKSHIVNLHEIKSVQQGRSAKVILKNNETITVSQRRKTELLAYLKKLNRMEKAKA